MSGSKCVVVNQLHFVGETFKKKNFWPNILFGHFQIAYKVELGLSKTYFKISIIYHVIYIF